MPAAGVIGEAMVMLTLARFVLEKTGGDSMPEVLDNLRPVPARIARRPAGRAATVGGHAPGGAADGSRRRRGAAGRPGRLSAVDVVLVGLPGSGKTAVGRRLASRHGAAFIDLDDGSRGRPAGRSARSSPRTARPAFRRLERDAVLALGAPDHRLRGPRG